MHHLRGDAAGVRLALPEGWVELDPGGVDAPDHATTVQLITIAEWDRSRGLRPTMTVSLLPAASEHMTVRVLAEARASLDEVHVVSIDPWPVPGAAAPGRRLVFAHVDGTATLCTLVWAVSTTSGEVLVTAHADSIDLHRHDRAFAQAVAGIEVAPTPSSDVADVPGTADLARHAGTTTWTDVAPAGDPVRTAIVADPDARILVEVSVGTTSLRFDANLAGDQATVSATTSPRELERRPPDDVATFRLPVTRLALAVAQWLGLGPARTAAGDPVTIPISLVMRRLLDPSVPAPTGADATTWQQPWFLWTLRSSATDSGLVMVDTGSTGQCAVMETDDEQTTRFAPLSSYDVWLTLNWLISESLVD